MSEPKNGQVMIKPSSYEFMYVEPGSSMINLFKNRGLITKIANLYPKTDPQYKWLTWGKENCLNFKEEFQKQTNVPFPSHIKEGIARVVRFTVLLTLLDERERMELMREGRSDAVIRKHCLT